MTTAALVLGGRLRPPSTMTGMTGVRMAEETGGRVRLVASIDPTAEDALAELARVRFGGVKSRALDWCIALGAAVLADPATLGAADPLAALAVYCSGDKTD